MRLTFLDSDSFWYVGVLMSQRIVSTSYAHAAFSARWFWPRIFSVYGDTIIIRQGKCPSTLL